jgi:predicted phage terminase large subunit-like protein
LNLLKKEVEYRTNLINQLKIEKELNARNCAASLAHFTKEFWSVIEPETSYVHGWHIDAICEHLEAVSRFEIKELIINLPYRHMKSILTAVMFPAWVWIDRPQLSFIYGSHSEGLALRDSIKTRDIITSPKYIEMFKPKWKLRDDRDTMTEFKNTAGGVRKAVGVKSSVTGEGGDFLCVDDLLDAKKAHSEVAREEANDWLDKVFSSRFNDQKRHAKLITMQRLHEDDPSGHVLKKMKDGKARYQRLVLQAQYDPDSEVKTDTVIGLKDPRTKKGELLWPERFDDSFIEDAEADLGDDAHAQLQQDPKVRAGGLFPMDQWQYFEKTPSPILEIIQFIDCAQKPGLTNDYSVIATWARTVNGFYILDVVREKTTAPILQALVEANYELWKPRFLVIEDKSAGSSLIQYLQAETTIPVIAFDPGQNDKVVRATAATPSLKAKKLFLPKGAKWVDDFKKEHQLFPKGKFDDQVDTTSMGVEYFQKHKSSGPRIRSA